MMFKIHSPYRAIVVLFTRLALRKMTDFYVYETFYFTLRDEHV